MLAACLDSNGTALADTEGTDTTISQKDSNMTNNNYYSRTSRVDDVINDPDFGDFGRLIFPANHNYWSGETLGNIRLLWYSNDPDKTVEIVNYMKGHAAKGDTIFYNIYSDSERAQNPNLRDTGLFFFRSLTPTLSKGEGARAICRLQCRRRICLRRGSAGQLSAFPGTLKERL